MNRILEWLDTLVKSNLIDSDIIAQTGYSTYIPKYFKSKQFFQRDEYMNAMDKSSIVITHGGTGAIISALKKNKKVIAIPRDVKYGEHVDNHQFEIVDTFESQNMIIKVTNLDMLEDALKRIGSKKFERFNSTQNVMINEIKKTIMSWENERG